MITDATTWDVDRMEAVVKQIKPDIVACDSRQVPTRYVHSSVLALKAAYIRFRVIGKQHGCCILQCLKCLQRQRGGRWLTSPCLREVRQVRLQKRDIMFCSPRTRW